MRGSHENTFEKECRRVERQRNRRLRNPIFHIRNWMANRWFEYLSRGM